MTIQGNFIGTDVTGTQDFGHPLDGIVLQGDNHTVGGSSAAAGNLISGNDRSGILYVRSTRSLDGGSGAKIQGNRIGTTADGSGRLGNGSGILVGGGVTEPFGMDPQTPGTPQGPVRSTIGGSAAGEGNTIAYNDGPGIAMIGEEIRILGNSIYENSEHGIDLGNDGVTDNDAGDMDTGIIDPNAPFFPPGAPIPPQFLMKANQVQNFPIITSVTLSGGIINVNGTLNSLPNTQYRLEFFANAAADASGNGEGRRLLGFLNATTNPAGDASFSQGFTTQPGQFITATATDPSGNTSEFSLAVAISGASNTAPVAADDVAATLDGSGSSDPDGGSLGYAWSVIERPDGSVASLVGAGTVGPTFTPDVRGSYSVQLIVNDGEDDSPPDTVVIEYLNTAPVADAGADQDVMTGEFTGLDGSGSSDFDGDDLNFRWAIVGAPPGSEVILSDWRATAPNFTPDKPGLYIVELTVDDGLEYSTTVSVLINAEADNTAPVSHAGADQQSRLSDTVMLDGSASSDIDEDDLTYQWSFNTRPAGSSATLSDDTAEMPTFVADVKGTFELELVVNDGTVDSDPDTVTITVVIDEIFFDGFEPIP